jgi:hypothetical protein
MWAAFEPSTFAAIGLVAAPRPRSASHSAGLSRLATSCRLWNGGQPTSLESRVSSWVGEAMCCLASTVEPSG